MGAKSTHSKEHLKVLQEVEDAYVNEHADTTPHETIHVASPVTEKKVPHRFQDLAKKLWKLEKGSAETLDSDKAHKFFEEAFAYCEELLHAHGIYFNPTIKKEDIIQEWMVAFGLHKNKEISYDEFVLALQAFAEATHPEGSHSDHNPILLETFTHEFVIPNSLKKYEPQVKDHVDSVPVPIELTGLGVELVVQGIAGSDVKGIVTRYAGGEIQPNHWAKSLRDIFQKHVAIPLKVYAHPGHEGEVVSYLPFSAGVPFQFHLVCFVYDLTIPITDKIKEEFISEINLLNKYMGESFGNLPHAVVIVVGNNLEEKHDEGTKKAVMGLAEKYGAIYTEMSGKTGLFVSKGLNKALRIAVGHRQGYMI